MNQGNITDDGSQPHRYDVLFKFLRGAPMMTTFVRQMSN